MHNKRQEYLSGISRNIGFAFSAPFCSLVFQWVVFEKSLLAGHFYFAILLLIVGFMLLLFGYIILKER